MSAPAAAVDEMVDGHGGVRPHWRALLSTLSSMERGELAERSRRLELAAQEDGAVPGWRLDPVPLPLTSAEFSALEDGLAQRAELLELLLQDLYGPRAMLQEGRLPASLVYANPAYLRACRTHLPGGAPVGRHLHTYAADLQRGPDGQWRVQADRTGGLFGVGYARESRRLLARVLPELFRTGQVHQLRPFFDSWGDALLRLPVQIAGRSPVVALLTQGAEDPHWPEHLALSRDLACALVESRDLTVRGGVLTIKTLKGLQPVDVLLRRVPGATVDPLELEAGPDGVVGLLDAVRNGAVHIVNQPGAAVVEAPALGAFMPALCRRLLDEPLRLPTLPTVWLADEGAPRMVAQGFDRWSVRPAMDGATPPTPLISLRSSERAVLERAIVDRPWAFAGCATVAPSRAPCFSPEGLTALPVTLRLFLMHDGTGWRMMQGGLARVLRPGEHGTEVLAPGALLKDVWVMREEGLTIYGPAPVNQAPVALRRTAGDLPSRVADDFFWLGRYVERLEAQGRLARAVLARRARGAPLPRELAEIAILHRCLASAGMDNTEGGTAEDQVRAAFLPTGSIGAGLAHIARLVEALRDRLTVETYGAFVHALRAARTEVAEAGLAGLDGLVHALTGLQRLATTVAGVTADGMVRGGGRLFLDLGRRTERAIVGAYVLATLLNQPASRTDGTLRMVLELFDSAITYRSRYLSVLQPVPVLDLVLSDAGNPRALAYQFQGAAGLLEEAGDAELAAAARALQAQVQALLDQVAASLDPAAAACGLSQPLIGIGNQASALSERVTRRFFALLPKRRSIGAEVA